MLKRRAILLMALMAIVFSATAQTNYEKYIDAANNGDAEAQYEIGICYLNGDGVSQDKKQGINWIQKSADQDYALAINELGVSYLYGTYTYKDESKGIALVKKAADMNCIRAINNMGIFYCDGFGVKKDVKKGIAYLQKAADMGNFSSLAELGRRYVMGIGVKKDLKNGILMLEKAEEQNNKYAQCTLGYCYEHGIGVRRDEEEAFAMYKKSADQNYSIAQTNLGVFYLNGKGVKKDIDQAIYWFQKAADQNNAQAKQALKEAFAERQMQQYAYAQSPTAHNQQPLQAPAPQPVVNKPSSPVDMNIPTTDKENSNTFAIVIGNEKYKNVAEVPFAVNDAKVFGEYLEKTLGVPHEQIKLIENAGFNDIRIAVNWLSQAMAVCEGKGKAIVYYAGHGIPNESDNSSYLLPVDGIGSDPASAYSLKDFYDKLGNMQAQSVTVFLDACFSGTKRDNGMLVAARGVAIKVKPSAPKGKMVVFSAAQGDETAYPYRDMQHGLFTYFLLKKLQETKGNVTLGELGDYLKSEVKRQSFLKNNKVQTPMISVATALQNQWKTTKL